MPVEVALRALAVDMLCKIQDLVYTVGCEQALVEVALRVHPKGMLCRKLVAAYIAE